MFSQIIAHTPLYVWAILAFLIFRGVTALHTRAVALNKLFIIPIVMTGLALVDIAAKFGLGGIGFATWALTATATLALLYTFGAARVAPAATPGQVIVRGSAWPLVLMIAIFMTKYVASVALAVQPQLHQSTGFSVVVCALFGLFSGYFAGRLARDVKAYLRFAPDIDAARAI